MNKYMILNIGELDEYYHFYVGETSTQRKSIDGTKVVIKLFLNGMQPLNTILYSHDEILEIMATEEWQMN